MTAPDARQPDEQWRVGQHYGIHVYAGDKPIATFHDPADARRAVDAVNATPARAAQDPTEAEEAAYGHGLEAALGAVLRLARAELSPDTASLVAGIIDQVSQEYGDLKDRSEPTPEQRAYAATVLEQVATHFALGNVGLLHPADKVASKLRAVARDERRKAGA